MPDPEPTDEDPPEQDPIPTVHTSFPQDLRKACDLEPLQLVTQPGDRADDDDSALRYQYRKEVGRGGMAAVYEVFDKNLRRGLAMKVASTAAEHASRDFSSRFLEEAQITGQLDHPGVVPVHDLGLDEHSRLYFTMSLVRGRNFEEIIRLVHAEQEGWNRTRALSVLLKVCQTMSYAHDRGVIHRDLKPANVMVGRYGEVYVMDWGLARVLGREEEQERREGSSRIHTVRSDHQESDGDQSPLTTMAGTVFGTPHYMPREQALGKFDQVGRHSDVYSVGAMLYHLLAGHVPYHSSDGKATPHSVLMEVIEGPPEPLSALTDDVPAELVAICERAMQREPGDRYPSMAELGEDLRAFLEQRVVHAYETGAAAELKKWILRNKALAASFAAVFLLVVGSASGFGYVEAKHREEVELKNTELTSTNERLDAELLTNARVIDFLTGMFEQQDPRFSRGESITVKEVLDGEARRIEGELAGEPGLRSHLMQTMGRVYQSLGLYDEARPLLDQAVELARSTYGEEDPTTWKSLATLGSLHVETGDNRLARPLLEHAFDAQLERFGMLHVDTLESAHSLANLLYHEGEFDEADDLFGRILEAQSELLGARDRTTLNTRLNMAALYAARQQLPQAEAAFREVAADLTSVFGEEDPLTQFALANQAFILTALERYDEAEALSLKTLDLRRTVLKEDHPDTLTSLHNLAEVHFYQGRLDEAEAEYAEAWEGRSARLGEDDPETLLSMSSLAFVIASAGRPDEAQDLYEAYLALARDVLPRGDTNLIYALQWLTQRYAVQGRDDEARALDQEAEQRLQQR